MKNSIKYENIRKKNKPLKKTWAEWNIIEAKERDEKNE